MTIRFITSRMASTQNHIQKKRQGIAALASRTILRRIVIQKALVKCYHDIIRQRIVIPDIISITHNASSPYQIFDNHVIVCRSHQRDRRIAGESCTEVTVIIPVTQTERKDMIICAGREIVHISAHILVILLNQRIVPIGFVIHIRENDQSTSPLGRFGKGIHARSFEHDILRCGAWHGSVAMLGIRHILHNLRSESCQVIIV